MPENDFVWTTVSIDAAQMVADGDLSFDAVAQAAGTSAPTLRKWREHPEFVARVEVIRKDYRDFVRRRGIAVKERRIQALNDRHRLMMQVIRERGADPRLAAYPGGSTGVMVATDWKWPPKKKVKPDSESDETAELDESEAIPILEFDSALLRELREHEKQTAQELGDWTEKQEISGGVSVAVTSIDAGLAKIYGDAGTDASGPA
jgi:hypothetical protein